MNKLYYVWDINSDLEVRWADSASVPYVKGARWMRGARIDVALPLPFEFKLEPLSTPGHGPHMPEFLPCTMPIFRDDLIAALHEAGVDNLELFDLTIVDPDNGQRYTNYKAVNIVGVVAAADMGKSEATVHGAPIIDVDFDKLVIDESKPQGALMFRLAESVNVIMVHKKVKQHLEAKGFTGIKFYDPGEIAT